jgi:thiol-disulfide isomerase/thioredoxin
MDRTEYLKLLDKNESVLVVFITATWCGPCNKIKAYVEKKLECIPFLLIDVDKDSNVYSSLRSKKQIRGVPTLLAYTKGSIIPSATMSGTNEKEINAFFDNLDFLQ